MKLASLKSGRDGQLIVVNRDGTRYTSARTVAPTLQAALEAWPTASLALAVLSQELEAGTIASSPLDISQLAAPLPRAYEWVDGSAFIQHIRLVRKARGAEPPASLLTDPLVYQGGSSVLLGPTDPIELIDSAHGLDFEAEVAVILADTPRGTTVATAESHVALLLLANDITLRELVPSELAKGFGFFVSKPATAFSPFAVTPDELGPAWRDGRVHLRLRSTLNGTLMGDPEASEMHFSFYDLMAHITQTRAFGAGTILGSGTVSNVDTARGVSCLAERRMLETLAHGAPRTPYLKPGDHIEIEMLDANGASVFGRISQTVVRR
ncbi:MAG: fumarylacetoacetate hydrolase family protein [Polyangiaceae bacterium]|nr:fumarylacetoacetate hydrolase family protein [Polyangiaceae bacterium]